MRAVLQLAQGILVVFFALALGLVSTHRGDSAPEREPVQTNRVARPQQVFVDERCAAGDYEMVPSDGKLAHQVRFAIECKSSMATSRRLLSGAFIERIAWLECRSEVAVPRDGTEFRECMAEHISTVAHAIGLSAPETEERIQVACRAIDVMYFRRHYVRRENGVVPEPSV